jgi:hypothetical protein
MESFEDSGGSNTSGEVQPRYPLRLPASRYRINPKLAHDFLEEAVDDHTFDLWYPRLEALVDIDASGARRLMARSLDRKSSHSHVQCNGEDYGLGEIAKPCLKGAEGSDRAAELCRRLKKAISEHHIHVIYYDDFSARC